MSTNCSFCGREARGFAWGARGQRLCHTSDPATDCYSQVIRGAAEPEPVSAPLEPLSDDVPGVLRDPHGRS